MSFLSSRVLKKYDKLDLLKKLDDAKIPIKNNNTILHLCKLLDLNSFDDDTVVKLMQNYVSCSVSDRRSPNKEIFILLYTKEIGEILYDEHCKKCSEAGKLSYKTSRTPFFEHFFPEYWIKKGYTEKEANEIVAKRKKNAADASRIATKNRPSYLTNVHIDYYLNKGMSIDEAKKALKERQNTISLESFKKRYGDKEGTKRFNERNKKWLATLNNKTNEEKQRLYEARIKGFTRTTSTSVSNEESYILNLIEEKLNIKIERQFEIKYQNKVYFFDGKYNDVIIEFNGDFWHCNPLIFEKTYIHPIKKCTAQEIWEADDFKCNVVAKDYKKFIIWENELNDTDKIIERFRLYL